MSKQNFDSEELVKLFHKIHQKLDWLTCAIKECCSKIPINIGDGIGLFKRFANNKWEFKSLVEGDNITITETTEEIIISSQATPFSCEDVNECLGISEAGDSNKFLNEQGDFITVSGSGFTCSDLDSCSTSNLQEGSRLYFTDGRAVTALTGQNISLFTNNAGYVTESAADLKYYSITNPDSFITSSALTPYLLSSTASSTYEPVITPGTTSQYYRGDKTFQTVNKSTVGLGNVDNTSDSAKPVSTATQTALDLKANKTGIIQVVGEYLTNTTLTGTTAETSLGYVLIPANTYSEGKTLWADSLLVKPAGVGNITARMRISTSATPTIASATLLATYTISSSTRFVPFSRMNIHIDSATSTTLLNVASTVIQDNVIFLSISDLNIDWTVDQYIHVSAQLITSGDSITLHKLRIFL